MSEERQQAAPRVPCFKATRRVEFHETDMAGIVHFANFFRYMEAAEHAFLRSIGHTLHSRAGDLVSGWPRVNATCDYRRPVRFGDVLTIHVFLEELRTRSVRYGFEIFTEDGGPVAAVGTLTAVCVSLDAHSGEIKAVPIPEEMRKALEAAAAGA